MNRLSAQERASVVEIMTQASSKASSATKRVSLLKKGIPSTMTDELITLNETCTSLPFYSLGRKLTLIDEDFPTFLFRLDKLSSYLRKEIHGAIEEMRTTVEHAILSGVTRSIYVTPLMLGSRHEYFKDGVCFEVCRRNKRYDLLAAGGRFVAGRLYDLPKLIVQLLRQIRPSHHPTHCPNHQDRAYLRFWPPNLN